jgi:hypothetical protein
MSNSIPVPSFLAKVLEERKGFKKGELFTSKLDGVDATPRFLTNSDCKSFTLYDMYRAIGKMGRQVYICLEDDSVPKTVDPLKN